MTDIVDISPTELTDDAGVFNVTVDVGKFVTVLVYYELKTDMCRIHTANLSPLVVAALTQDPTLKSELRELVMVERDARREQLSAFERKERAKWN